MLNISLIWLKRPFSVYSIWRHLCNPSPEWFVKCWHGHKRDRYFWNSLQKWECVLRCLHFHKPAHAFWFQCTLLQYEQRGDQLVKNTALIKQTGNYITTQEWKRNKQGCKFLLITIYSKIHGNPQKTAMITCCHRIHRHHVRCHGSSFFFLQLRVRLLAFPEPLDLTVSLRRHHHHPVSHILPHQTVQTLHHKQQQVQHFTNRESKNEIGLGFFDTEQQKKALMSNTLLNSF